MAKEGIPVSLFLKARVGWNRKQETATFPNLHLLKKKLLPNAVKLVSNWGSKHSEGRHVHLSSPAMSSRRIKNEDDDDDDDDGDDTWVCPECQLFQALVQALTWIN